MDGAGVAQGVEGGALEAADEDDDAVLEDGCFGFGGDAELLGDGVVVAADAFGRE